MSWSAFSGADTDTVAAAPEVTMPLLIVVARRDSTFAVPARLTDRAATSSPGHRLVVLSGNVHASVLFSVDATVLPTIAEFVRAAMPPTR